MSRNAMLTTVMSRKVAYYSFTEIIDNCHGDINVYYNYNELLTLKCKKSTVFQLKNVPL